jgi:hypothetical protein
VRPPVTVLSSVDVFAPIDVFPSVNVFAPVDVFSPTGVFPRVEVFPPVGVFPRFDADSLAEAYSWVDAFPRVSEGLLDEACAFAFVNVCVLTAVCAFVDVCALTAVGAFVDVCALIDVPPAACVVLAVVVVAPGAVIPETPAGTAA